MAVETPRPRPMILGRRRSVVASSLMFAIGAGGAYLLLRAVELLQTVLVMLTLALLIALTLEPLVTLLVRRTFLPRWIAAVVAWLLAIAVLAAPVVLAVDAATAQLPGLTRSVPRLITQAESHLGGLGTRLKALTGGSAGSSSSSVSPDKIVTYVLSGGQLIIDVFADVVVVGILSLWLLIALPRLVEAFYQLVPRTRRPAVETVTEDVLGQVSRFMLANVLTSVLAGVATWAWAWGWGIPYPILLGSLVAVLDLIPTVGSTIGGITVSLIALTVGLPTAIATTIFYVGFRVAEDYLIQPRAMRYSVELPGVITIPAVLIGGAVLGLPGALFAVPAALIIRAIVRDVALPALDRS
ncbi:MAG TPA: AI-2E family transporter [Jatrophihabitantaceae bacterium]|jgi:predicted PurR-regulated permease PerM|nr:AI-2E family transporter [Jatrophihabitantaceae bacterium]